MARSEPSPNPLSSRRPQRESAVHPMKAHAIIWNHVNQMQPDELAQKTEQTNYVSPILGELAGNPKVTSKDVIKAAAQAAADEQITPTEAVQFISKMPSEPDKLQPWLRQLYGANLTAAVHMKAAQLKGAQQATAPPQGGPGTPPDPTSMTPGEAPA